MVIPAFLWALATLRKNETVENPVQSID
jgi:hypothetical protein